MPLSDEITRKRTQWFAFQEVNKSLKGLSALSPDLKVVVGITYFLLTGGQASEYNILQVMRHIGVNVNKEDDRLALRNMLAYYVGGNIIEIIDNGLGLASTINDPKYKYFERGKQADFSDVLREVEKIRAEILLKVHIGSEESG